MNTKVHLIPFLLAGTLAAFPAALAQEAHSHGGAAELALSLNQGVKWQTDEALRTGMSAIREAFATVIEDVHAGRLDNSAYARLADRTEAQIDYIVGNCKLPEQPDEQLHLVLAHMIEGIEQLRAPDEGPKGAVAVIEGLNAYGEHFDHPGWQMMAL